MAGRGCARRTEVRVAGGKAAKPQGGKTCCGLLPTHRPACLVAVLLVALTWRVSGQQGSTPVLTLSGQGPVETQMAVLRVLKTLETTIGVPLRTFYRVTTSPAAAADLAADVAAQSVTSPAGSMHFAVTEQPLSAAARASFTGNPFVGDSVHYPLFVNQYGLYYNVPGNGRTPLNLTACLAARVLTGDIADWTHPDLADANPGFQRPAADSFRITVLLEPDSSGSTLALLAWLARACPSVPVSYANLAAATNVVKVSSSSALVSRLMVTPFSIGCAAAAVGQSEALPEFALEAGGTPAGTYVTTSASNSTNMRAALATSLPTTLTGDYSTVSPANLAAASVSPILSMAYLVTKRDWSQGSAEEGQRGQAVAALCRLFLSAAVSGTTSAAASGNASTTAAPGMLSSYGLLSVGDTVIAAATQALDTAVVHHAASVPYTLTDGNDPEDIAPSRTTFDVVAYQDVLQQLSYVRRVAEQGAVRLVRGAGSSAVSLFLWRLMAELRARAASPVQMVYRAAGSGAGSSEVVAKYNGYKPYIDFGASDTPMSEASYTDLTVNAKQQLVHVPIMLTPMNFFVNIPAADLPSRYLQLSPCTLARIMQGDITNWAHPDIAADNAAIDSSSVNGTASAPAGPFKLPDANITVFYRASSSGTTSVITAYLTKTCADWKLGSGSTLSNWPATHRPTANSANMSTAVSQTSYSIGYMDAANGLDVGLLEVAVLNKDGKYVTSQAGDVSGAALALFKSDAWPSSPVKSFASVSVLNQPGPKTFPIVAMPFMFVRTDLTDRGDAGPLLVSLITFMLDDAVQNAFLPALGFSPLPREVQRYAVERALPLLQVDTQARAWTMEMGNPLTNGRGGLPDVFSSFAGSYDNTNSQQFADFYKAYNAKQIQDKLAAAGKNPNDTNTRNATYGDVPPNLQAQLDDLSKQLDTLRIVTIVGVVFGVVGLGLGMFASCRMFVSSTLWGDKAGLVHPGSMTVGGVVKRTKSGLSENSVSFHA